MSHRQRFMSLWEMLHTFDSGKILTVISMCSNMQKKLEQAFEYLQANEKNLDMEPVVLSKEEWDNLIHAAHVIGHYAEKWVLTGIPKACRDVIYKVRELHGTTGVLDSNFVYITQRLVETMIASFINAMSDLPVFLMTQTSMQMLNPDGPIFGEAVADSFPDASFDIEEAAKCRALGRWTASVMHLMRVLEVGLITLAAKFGVVHDNNWNSSLNAIEAHLRSVKKKLDGAEAEQWAAEAGTHLRFIKNAFRNLAMHPIQVYDEERAITVFENTKSFMQHLAVSVNRISQ